jgi:hypothetical protein
MLLEDSVVVSSEGDNDQEGSEGTSGVLVRVCFLPGCWLHGGIHVEKKSCVLMMFL